MILVLGGTLEGREIAGTVAGMGYQTLLTVVSGYGAEMAANDQTVEVLVGPLDAAKLKAIISERKVRLIIDATHPYAGIITSTAWQIARETKVPFIRYQRPPVAESAGHTGIYQADNYEEAADLVKDLGETAFLTIGSKNLKPFVEVGLKHGMRIVARVLPDAGVLAECAALGLAPRNIIAVQGPFSTQMNISMLREYRADVLVTKDSGRTGGTDTKMEAAALMDIPVVVVGRPEYQGVPVTGSISEILEQIRKTINQIGGYQR